MKALAALFADAGARDVRTYLQSGNVVFRAPPDGPAALVERAARAVADRRRTGGEPEL